MGNCKKLVGLHKEFNGEKKTVKLKFRKQFSWCTKNSLVDVYRIKLVYSLVIGLVLYKLKFSI